MIFSNIPHSYPIFRLINSRITKIRWQLGKTQIYFIFLSIRLIFDKLGGVSAIKM